MIDERRLSLIREKIKLYTEANTVSIAAARAALIGEGIYTSAGELKPEYGGATPKPRKKGKKAA